MIQKLITEGERYNKNQKYIIYFGTWLVHEVWESFPGKWGSWEETAIGSGSQWILRFSLVLVHSVTLERWY